MSKRLGYFMVLALPMVALSATPEPAAGYVGPGSVISGIGAFLAVTFALIASVFGFVWFPLKKLFRRLRGGDLTEKGGRESDLPASADA